MHGHTPSVRFLFLATLILGAVACSGSGGDDFEDRVASEHSGDRPVASPGSQNEPAGPIEEREVVYATLDGDEVRGFLATPAEGGGHAPGILVIHEWWGLNDNIRSMARQLAGEGYAALAVDLYDGQVADEPQAARALMSATRERTERLQDNMRQAHTYLREQLGADRIGVIGWCFGGAWSLRTALLLGDQVDATVIYYGFLITDPAELEPLRSPVLGLFGDKDGSIPVDTVRAFESAVQQVGRPITIHVYEGAGHAFANPSGTRYDEAAAGDAWAKTSAFLGSHLKGSGQ